MNFPWLPNQSHTQSHMGGCVLLAIALAGCGEVELSRPKDRALEPHQRPTASSRSTGSSRTGSGVRRPSPSKTTKTNTTPNPQSQINQALRVIQNPKSSDDAAAQAVDRLAYHKEKALPAIRKLVDDPRPKVRIKAVISLSRIGDRSDASRLAQLLVSDSLLDVRSWSAHGLGRMRAENHMDALLKGMEDKSSRVRLMSQKAMHDLAGFSYPFNAQATDDLRAKQMIPYRKNLSWLKSQARKRTAQLEQAARNAKNSESLRK